MRNKVQGARYKAKGKAPLAVSLLRPRLPSLKLDLAFGIWYISTVFVE
jgi:hypothetical protein